ncbi:golgi-specific brefeldin A-resistance guanine nucleotide exchange factor 1 [Mytilus galloprovincialis]|uniref:Golgi-specific brefeldin A-resistance guanine nucleotide exchange factor 1 n=1 Tax=Mytilus galloprovincialis TaxID=29158 RepID=A0A8B6F6F8_MYTGA|nr:golgi-specific brefeldin A-resistance guanine nucleotide exchange factor 1 [Mytilus galloprovincialis]
MVSVMKRPKNGIYIIQGEISLVVTAMRRSARWGQHTHQDEEGDPLLKSFSKLKDLLNSVSDLEEIEPNTFLSPFLEVIRSEDTTGPITGLALTSVKKLISYGLLDPSTDTAAAAIENIADAVTHARFVGTDPGSDEVVLMKILYVLGALLLSPAGVLLTNESVCEIMQSCFRICFEMRLSELLRKSAEHTLMDMVQLLFTRLPQFKEDPKWVANMKKLKMRAGGVDPSRMGRKKRSPKPRPSRQKYNQDISTSTGPSETSHNAQNTDESENVDTSSGPIDGVAYVNAPRERLATTPATPGDDGVIDICKQFQEAAQKEIVQMHNANQEEPEEISTQESSLQGTSLEDSTEQPVPSVPVVLSLPEEEDMMRKSSSETDLYQGNERLGVLQSEICDDSESIHSTTDMSETASQDDFINSQGVRFMPHSHSKEGSGPLLPYGLPCVRELFRFLISLTNPLDRHNTDVMIHMGLSLLAVAFESGADHIGQYESLLFLVKDEMCRHLFLLLQSERLSLFSASIRVCFLVFESIRSHLKFQLEMYLTKLSDIIISESPRVMYETREIALDAIVQLFKIPGMVTELFINYDCDLYCSNLFEDTTKLLSKNAFPVQGLFSTHLLSLDALLSIIDCIEPHCYNRILAKQKTDTALKESQSSTESEVNTEGSTHKQDSKMSKEINVKKNQSVRQNRMKVTEEKVPTSDEIASTRHKKKVYYEGTKQFNVKPAKGIQYLQEQGYLKSPLDPNEVVIFLKENPRLDKAQIGEYISRKTNGEVLKAFVTSFHFEDLRLDEALRLYLEAFRLPGEAPVISYLIEHFSEHWSRSNGEPFANYDAAFTLTYAIIMLNVDQHNHNAKKQNIPMTNAEFKKNVNKCNGGQDFDQDMLEEIYNAIRNDEIVMPSEHTGLVKENYMWKVLLRRGGTKDGTFIHAPPGSFDHELFNLTWGSTVAALSFVFDKSSEEAIIQKSITGFRKCAMIAAYYGMSDVFDNLVISLCKFTTLLSAHENPESISVSFGGNMKAKLAAQTVFQLTHRHGDILREGWKNILDCMIQLFRAKLLPKSLIEVEDFIDTSGKISIIREDNTTAQRSESGVLSSFYSYFSMSETASTKGPTPEEQEATRFAQECIEECNLENLITDSRFLREESLQELVKALIVQSQGPEAHVSSETAFDEDAAVFFLEFLIKVVLQNRDRVNLVWQGVRDHIYNLVVNASEHTFLVERAVVGLLRLAIRLLRREEVAPQVLTSLRITLMMKPSVIHCITRHIAFGLHDLLRTNAANIHTGQDWFTLFTLLEVVGAGANPPPILQVCSGVEMSEAISDAGAQSDSEVTSVSTSDGYDRGYNSDGDLYESQSKAHRCPSPLEVRPVPENGSWLLVNRENISTTKEEQPRKTSLTTNQYTIELNEELYYCDSKSLLKSSETLSFLVRDAAHITPLNFESCVHAIRSFVETSLNGGRQRILLPEKKPKMTKNQHKKSKHKMKKSNSSPSRLHQNINVSDEEGEVEGTAAGIHSLSIQLLDLMHTLHTRAASIYKSWAEEDKVYQDPNDSIDAGTNALWVKCWCPLLQGIARLCCDVRRQVRSQALTYLQRALLVHDLQTLSAAEWESCFNKVLFPLLTKLLENINIQDPTGMEETRMRASALLTKVFLQHLTPLLSLSTFTALWLTILEFMDKYMHADNSDLLAEAIPESLKNMLLVMDTAGIFQTSHGAESTLWKLSWDRIDTFLPNLRNDVFKPTVREVKPTPTLVPPTPEITQNTPSVPQPPEMHSPHEMEEEEEEHLEGVTVVKDVNEYLGNYSSHPKVHSPTHPQSPPSYLLQTHPSHILTMESESGIQMGNNCVPLLLNPDVIDTSAVPYISSPQGMNDQLTQIVTENP